MARWTRVKDRQPTDDDYPILTASEIGLTEGEPVYVTVLVHPNSGDVGSAVWLPARHVDWDAGLPSEIEEPARGIEIDGAPGYRYWVEDDQVVGENDRGGRIYQPVWATVQSAKIAAGLGLLNADESPDPEPAAPVLSDSEERFLREAASWVERRKPYTATDRYHAEMLRRIADRLGGNL